MSTSWRSSSRSCGGKRQGSRIEKPALAASIADAHKKKSVRRGLMLSVKSDIIGFSSLRRGAVSTRSPLPKDPIFISAAPPKSADTGRILTTRAPTLGRWTAGHSVGAGPCPRRANALSPARTTAMPVVGNRRQTCRNAAPPCGSFLAEPGNSLFLPVLATKIPCSGWAGNL